MERKNLDLRLSVYELTEQEPALKEVLARLGFDRVLQPGLRATVGRAVTLPLGCSMRGIPLEKVTAALRAAGYEVTGLEEVAAPAPGSPAQEQAPEQGETTVERLKGFLRRLNAGEALPGLKAEFSAALGDVAASEILQAEQELLAEGTSQKELQKLCDLHGALFTPQADCGGCNECPPDLRGLELIVGHPLRRLRAENKRITALTEACTNAAEPEERRALLQQLKPLISAHYAYKGDLIYPLLETAHATDGPSRVMWAVDFELRQRLSALCRGEGDDASASELLERVLNMARREEHILLPLCAELFTTAQWIDLYRDGKEYVFGAEEAERWPLAEARLATARPASLAAEGTVRLGGGSLTVPQLEALLNTLPCELTFVDAENVNRWFNDTGEIKAFKRPAVALGRDVFSCHPPQVQAQVRGIIQSFKEGSRDTVAVWMNKGGREFLVEYFAVRSPEGEYLGTLESVRDMAFARRHFATPTA